MSKTHVEKFIDSCSNDQMMTILRYVKAQKEDRLETMLEEMMLDNCSQQKPFGNPVYPIVKEIRTEKDPDVIVRLLSSGNWVAVNGVNNRGELTLMLGRVNPASEDQEGRECTALPLDPDHQQCSE